MSNPTHRERMLPAECDLLVIGSGAGGLSAAVTAAALGLDVVVVEKDAQFGGTTAWSGGWMWIPRNPLAVEAGIREDLDGPRGPRAYLRHALGDNYDPARIDMFLEQGPRAVEFFRSQTALGFIDGNAVPDFHGTTPRRLKAAARCARHRSTAAGSAPISSVCARRSTSSRRGGWVSRAAPSCAIS